MSGASIPGDLAIRGGAFRRHSGPESVRDRLNVLFGIGEGAYWADENAGFPYRALFALRGTEILAAQSIFSRWLSDLDFISSVERVDVNYDKEARVYYFDFIVRSAGRRVQGSLNFSTGG